jgi:hypothetical protein
VTRLVRVGDLDVPQDLALERRECRVRQAAAVLGALVLAAGLLGLFGGGGPLSEGQATTADGVRLTYPRFAQLDTPGELSVRFTRGPAKVALANAYLQTVRLQPTSVMPTRVTTLADRTVFTFDLHPPAKITFEVEPGSAGPAHGVVYGPDGSPAAFTQVVYP